MLKAPTPSNEKERLAELLKYEILDTMPESSFDDITQIASEICETKVSAISLIDKDRQWFKSIVGLDVKETPRDVSWCGHAIFQSDIFEVPDSELDERFRDNPLYTGEPGVRFYAGVPLTTSAGYNIGTLCVIDNTPKQLSEAQKSTLRKLARQVTILIEAKLREIKLKANEKKVHAIFEGSHDAMIIFTANEIIDCNPKAVKLYNHESKASFLKKSISSLASTYQANGELSEEKNKREMNLAFENGFNHFECVHMKSTGEEFPCEILFSTFEYHGEKVIIGTFRDITERKNAEQLSIDVQSMAKVGGWHFAMETLDLIWTEETYRIHGIKSNQKIDIDFAISFYLPHDRTRMETFVKNGMESGTPWNEEFEIQDANGTLKWVRAIGHAERDKQGKIFKLKGTFQDITERKKLQINLDLQKRISQHQAKLASIGQLAAGVGHEINNPLAIIKGYLLTIEEDLRQNMYQDEQTYYMLKKINVASDRIVNIVNGLRTFSRSDATQLEVFSLKDAIDESFNLFNEIYQKEGISLNLNIQNSGHSRIYGNKGRIGQVIVNLLSNAKDATKGQDKRIIDISLKEFSGHVIIKFKDNGKGIPNSIKDKVFDPFFTTKDVNQGTGIGLSIVSSIIKEHDGEITFESSADTGTTFIISLPLDVSSKNQPTAVTKPLAPKKIKFQLKTLIVEDEFDIRVILQTHCTRMGMSVTLVENGQEALNEIKKEKYDLIISDIKMPVMSGPVLVEEIRSNKVLTQPKIIIMSGGVDENDTDSLNLKGMVDGYLYKPFTEQKLYDLVLKIFQPKT